MTNENIMQIIQNSQKSSDKPPTGKSKYTSLADQEPEEVEK